jgi:GNAT superfamily N-acetyltransferase
MFDMEKLVGNFRSFWQAFPSPGEGLGAGLTGYRTGLDGAAYNGVLHVGEESDVPAALDRARSHFEGLPWVWWVGPDSPVRTAARLESLGAALASSAQVMAISLAQVTAHPLPAGTEIVRLSGDAGVDEWVASYAPQFGIPEAVVPPLADAWRRRSDIADDLHRFQALHEGRIVGTTALLCRDGVAGIYAVSTAKTQRGLGIATALASAALLAGRDMGATTGTLQAADAAPLYARMGFEKVADLNLFAFKP